MKVKGEAKPRKGKTSNSEVKLKLESDSLSFGGVQALMDTSVAGWSAGILAILSKYRESATGSSWQSICQWC